MRDVCKLFQSFKNSLEDSRVKKFASKGGKFTMFGFETEGFSPSGWW